MRILTVLKSGGEYKPAHVLALKAQCAKYAPNAAFMCLTDMDVSGVETAPLLHKWPGWWSKLEMFRPDVTGDFVYMDLDTVIVGPLDGLAGVSQLAMLRDAYRDGKRAKEGLQSSVMVLPENERSLIWNEFIVNPALAMAFNRAGGDQRFLEHFWLNRATRLQDLLPGQIVSWKVDCKLEQVPPNARVVFFHGQPRPWAVGQFLHLYRQ